MKELEDLTEIEKTVLLKCCIATDFSLHCHVPKEAIMKGIGNDKRKRKYAKKAFNNLISSGFIIEHPTRGQTTYQLSKKGLTAGNKLKEDY